jgi:pilus assembly protein CpaF
MHRLLENQALTPDMASMFEMCVNAKLNVLISGGPGAVKTTLLNAPSGLHSER